MASPIDRPVNGAGQLTAHASSAGQRLVGIDTARWSRPLRGEIAKGIVSARPGGLAEVV
jgi:hypothetical protein